MLFLDRQLEKGTVANEVAYVNLCFTNTA